MELHEKLYTLRKEKGLSQQAVAEALHVSRQAISRWELGTSVPTTENLSSLSKLYDVSLDHLLNDASEPKKITVKPDRSSVGEEAGIGKIEMSPAKTRGHRKRYLLIGLSLILLLITVSFAVTYFLQKQDAVSIDILTAEQPTEETNASDFGFSFDWI